MQEDVGGACGWGLWVGLQKEQTQADRLDSSGEQTFWTRRAPPDTVRTRELTPTRTLTGGEGLSVGV